MVNTKHDTGNYDCSCYKREILSDANVLYDAFRKAEHGSDWKASVQKFEMLYLLNIAGIQHQLKDRTYEFHTTTKFTLVERGKKRVIRGEHIADRTIKHALCDEIVNPAIRPFLIYDNGASLKGRGIDFTRNRLLTHLHRYYRRHGTNEGYILLFDFSKYYDNILHSVLKDLFAKYIRDDDALWMLNKCVDRSNVDVSYMDDEEYEDCINTLFNSLEYEKINPALLTGEKFMEKHLYVGDQVSQTAGISYPIPIDNYIKIVKGEKFYARYMDDGYIIHESKEHLAELQHEITNVAAKIGITVNQRKTRICKLSDYWRFLQRQYSLTETGRIIQKINPKRLTTMRRKMKKLAGTLNEQDFIRWYRAWFNSNYKVMSKQQRQNLNQLFEDLKGERYVYSNVG